MSLTVAKKSPTVVAIITPTVVVTIMAIVVAMTTKIVIMTAVAIIIAVLKVKETGDLMFIEQFKLVFLLKFFYFYT